MKPSSYFEGSSVKETFENFWKLSIVVNTALMQMLVRERSIPLAEKDFVIVKKEDLFNIEESDEEGINEEVKEIEESKKEEPTPTI